MWGRIRRFVHEVRSDRTNVGVTAVAVECGNFWNMDESILGSVKTEPIRKGWSDGQ
jgi:hypothetical protein